MNRPRLFTSSLAAAAVAATLTFVAPPANAADADPQCGLPATTVQHEAETHTAWLWERTETTPGFTRFDFTRTNREYSYTDYTWRRWVVTQPAVPGKDAVPPKYEQVSEWQKVISKLEPSGWVHESEAAAYSDWDQIGQRTVEDRPARTEWVYDPDSPEPYAFRQKTTGELKFRKDQNWNSGPGNDFGWDRDEAWDYMVLRDFDAETHQEFKYERTVTSTTYEWSVDSPGEGWTSTGEVRQGKLLEEGQPAVDPIPEQGDWVTDTTTDPDTPPAGDGWELTDKDDTHTQWAYVAPGASWQATGNEEAPETAFTRSVDETPAGQGWVLAGSEDIADQVRTVRTEQPSATAPDADHQWSKVADSATVVTDKDAWTEEIPGTDACDEVGGPAVEDEDVNQGGGRHDVVAPEATPTDQVAGPQAAPAVTTGVLPNTGNGVSLGMAAAGLGSLAAGAVLMMLSRRNRFSVN